MKSTQSLQYSGQDKEARFLRAESGIPQGTPDSATQRFIVRESPPRTGRWPASEVATDS